MSLPFPSSGPSKAIPLVYGTEFLQFGELYLPDGPGPHPVAILLHGGFWRAAYGLALMTDLAKDLAQHGIAAWNIEYRRVGDPGGGWPGTLQDVAQATDFLHTQAANYALDLQRVVPVGHSAGGHLALWLAARLQSTHDAPLAVNNSPLSLIGVISLAGTTDLEHVWYLNLGGGAVAKFLGGGPEDVPERYALASPAVHLPLGIPQVLIHGARDNIVPLEVSQAYVKKALEAGDQVTLIELPEVEHFSFLDPASTAWSITREELQKFFF